MERPDAKRGYGNTCVARGENPDPVEKGLPLRMKIQGERRLDQPYQSGKEFKLKWDRFRGVTIVPDAD